MFRNVFIGVDGTSHGRDAIALAGVLAEPGASLTLVHVQTGTTPDKGADPDVYPSDPTVYVAGRDESQELLEAERAAVGVTAELATVEGPAVGPALHAIAEAGQADLLVVGACKHRLAGRILIGDDTRASVIGAACPVGIASHGYAAHPPPLTTIGVAFDPSEPSGETRAGLAVARELAARHNAEVISLDVPAAQPDAQPPSRGAGETESPDEEGANVLAGGLAEEGEGDPGPATEDAHALHGLPWKTLAGFADHVDLLVVGSRSHSLIPRLMFGSTPLRLTRRVHHPMLVMPHAATSHPEPAGND